MTEPITTASVPYALKQGPPAGGVKPVPAKQHPVHKAAQAAATKMNSKSKGK